MIKTLEERKRDLLETLKEEYSEKPRRWWQNKQPEYKTTWEYSERSDHFRPISDETVIRYDIKGALRGSASFFIIYSLMYFFQIGELYDGNFLFSMVVFSFFMLLPILRERKRKPKIILNETGIWISTIEQWILWQNLIASFVKKEDNGESLSYYLILHYYLETYDTFATSEFQINNLDMKLEDIAAEIEYRKRYRQNKTAIRR